MENTPTEPPLPRAIPRLCAATLIVLISFVSPAYAGALRATDPMLAAMLEKGLRFSAHLRELVDRIERSDLIVLADCGSPTGAQGRVVFVTAVAGWRYLNVRLRCQPPEVRLIALLAHELRHVVEIADAPFVRSQRELARHYEDIGFEVMRGRGLLRAFETYAARQAADRTRKQLQEAFRTTGAPVTGGPNAVAAEPQ